MKNCVKVKEAIYNLQEIMNQESVNPKDGLPLELFEFSTTLLPFVNVDLLVYNSRNQILLSWRDDAYYGKGWQIPGGVIRMMETIDERIQQTAIREIGCKVDYDPEPIAVHENIIYQRREGIQNQLERAHNIALLYRCHLPDGYMIDNGDRKETDEGYLRWFDKFPKNLLECHKRIPALKEWY